MFYTELFITQNWPYPTPSYQNPCRLCFSLHLCLSSSFPTDQNTQPSFSESCSLGKTQMNPLLSLPIPVWMSHHNFLMILCLVFSSNFFIHTIGPLTPLIRAPRNHFNTYRLIAVVIALFNLSMIKLWLITCKNLTSTVYICIAVYWVHSPCTEKIYTRSSKLPRNFNIFT